MKLFLASRATDPKTFKDIEDFIGGFKNKRILYIPTASNGEIKYGEWANGNSYKTIKSTDAIVTELSLEEHSIEEIETHLQNSDVIWFAGGLSGYLLYWIYRRELDVLLPKYLEKGLLFVGSSSGAGFLSKDQDMAEWYIGDEERGAAKIPGLGLIDFNFYPHYQDELYDQIQSKYKNGMMYLVKDGEAIILEDGKVTVIGEERKIIKMRNDE